MGLVNNQMYLIEKEDVLSFKFPEDEVLSDDSLKEKRMRNIIKGLKLGNKFKNKVQIYFEDSESLKRVVTSIWGITDNYIILKSNMLIPIKRIHNVSF